MFVYKGHCLAIGVGIQVNNLFYYTTSIRVAQGAKYEIPQTRSIPATITHRRNKNGSFVHVSFSFKTS